MRPTQTLAAAASLLFLGTGLPADAQTPDTVPLVALPVEGLLEDCLADIAAETPLQREGRVADAMAYVRAVHPDLDDAGARESAEILLAERCHLAPLPSIPAWKEKVGDRWVAHFGEHSIVHDLFQSRVASGGVPLSLVFFGETSLASGSGNIRDAIDAAGWQDPFWNWGCQGGDKVTRLYDARHGGSDTDKDNAWHLQKEEDEGCFDERHHIRLWSSSTGDNHPGPTYGGYALATAHYEVIKDGAHDPYCYDCARNYVTKDLLRLGFVDAVYKVNLGNGRPMPNEPNPDGHTYYLHMKEPPRPCTSDSVVRVYEHAGYLGECRAYNFDDANFAGDTFANGVSVHNQVSSVKVAPGFRAVFYDNAMPADVANMRAAWDETGPQRASKCSDNQFVTGGFNDLASALRLEKAHLANCYGSFSGVRGNEWWVQAYLTSSWQPQAMQARVHSGGAWGGWTNMAKQATGEWAASFHVPPGSIVQLRSIVGTGGGADLSPCYSWLPPSGQDASTVYCPDPFKATFSSVQGNTWWVQTNVASNAHVDAVEYRTSCGPYHHASTWKPLTKQSWGGWAASPSSAINQGTKVDFRARGDGFSTDWSRTSTEVDVSVGYLWPGGTTAAATASTAC